ncbi:50S ribosomal protein L32e [Candidatus Woesearchaeota archaeon]|nr:50S ribosomal protein L32e [Candidatus Woesearchaeota archaeon]
MTQLNALLELRSRIKGKKPEFIRQDNPKRMKLNYKWRKPKGIHSKIRHRFKGRRKMPSPGYKSPAAVKGLHATGLKMIIVSSPADLGKISKANEGVIIAGSVGSRKRLEILKKASEMKIIVLNLNTEESIKKIEDFMNSKKKKEHKEIKKEPASEHKKAEEAKEPENATDEQKKKAEKQEKDRVLTKRT